MSGLGDQCQRVGSKAKVESRPDIGERQHHRHLQDALHLAVRAGDHVHGT